VQTPPARSSSSDSAPRSIDKARQEKLFALLAKEGKQVSLEAVPMMLLGYKNGEKPVSVTQVTAVEGKTRWDFNRVQNRKDEYVFFFDDDKDNPESGSLAFRAGANFKLIGAIEYRKGKWIKIPPRVASILFAQQIDRWIETIDAN